MKLLGIYFGFNGFDYTFSKKLIEIFHFVFNCRFYFVFFVASNFLYNDPVSLRCHGQLYGPIFWC